MPSISDASAKENVWIALLGRRDIPVDGVEDYCNFLAQSLRDEGVRLELYRMDWDRSSRIGALLRLGRTARDWRGKWVLVQYTALGWSRRGFTGYLLAVIRILRFRKANVAVVFHEPSRQLSGSRGIDRLRGGLQDRVIRGRPSAYNFLAAGRPPKSSLYSHRCKYPRAFPADACRGAIERHEDRGNLLPQSLSESPE